MDSRERQGLPPYPKCTVDLDYVVLSPWRGNQEQRWLQHRAVNAIDGNSSDGNDYDSGRSSDAGPDFW